MDYLNLSPSPDSSASESTVDSRERGPTSPSGRGSGMTEPVNISMDDIGDATISATFQPSLRTDGLLPDLVLISSNNVYFYAHRYRILSASSNSFGGLFLFDPGPSQSQFLPTFHLPESGDVLNVVLHTMYGLSCLHFRPTLETVESALTALIKYGMPVQQNAEPYHPLGQLILSHAPYRPIETYALAGHYQLDAIAVTTSGHLLSFDLSRVTDELAKKMGPVYLKRLFLLHQSRLLALKEILLKPPEAHPPDAAPGCTATEKAKLTRAWALVTAQLVWDATPSKAAPFLDGDVPTDVGTSLTVPLSLTGISPNSLRALLEPVGDTLTCEACKLVLQQKVQEVVYSWSSVAPTI